MLYDCLWRTVLRGIVLRHTVLAKFFGTIAGGASGLSRIGTMAGGQPDGFYVTVLHVHVHYYVHIQYIYNMLYGIQDPGPCIHVTVYTDPYPVPHETTNTVYH